jgi:U3 small nucleolar RNA-associated protein 14
LFDTVVPEAIAIAQALGKVTERTTLTAKWGPNMLPLLSELAQETREAINAA